MTSRKIDRDRPVDYQIRLHGQLDAQWTTWFGGMTVILTDDGDTVLTGPVADQAALHGLLRKVRDIGIPLVSINEIHQSHKGSNSPASARGFLESGGTH
jgi:hypothetical protein